MKYFHLNNDKIIAVKNCKRESHLRSNLVQLLAYVEFRVGEPLALRGFWTTTPTVFFVIDSTEWGFWELQSKTF